MFTLVEKANAQKVIDFCRANNITTREADLLEWTLEPLFWWDSTIPAEGLNRASLILKSGIPVRGFLSLRMRSRSSRR